MSAPDLLRDAAQAIDNRAALRDQPGGERSMARTVAAFNALTGQQLSETQGWLFMCVLKMARATAGGAHHMDDWVDLAAYAALGGESGETKSVSGWNQVSVTIVDEKGERPYKPIGIMIKCCTYPAPDSGKKYCLNCGHVYAAGEIQPL